LQAFMVQELAGHKDASHVISFFIFVGIDEKDKNASLAPAPAQHRFVDSSTITANENTQRRIP
jgi:hypothetical protein